jgi:large subunit ribosomal protein L20
MWISRIAESVKQNGLSYSAFISKLKASNIEIDRKILANLVTENPEAFTAILDKVKKVN